MVCNIQCISGQLTPGLLGIPQRAKVVLSSVCNPKAEGSTPNTTNQ